MYLKTTLCTVVLALLVGCQQDSKPAAVDKSAVAEKEPVELTVEERLDLERTLSAEAAKAVRKLKNTADCGPYSEKVRAILSVTAEHGEREAAIDKTMGEATQHGCVAM